MQILRRGAWAAGALASLFLVGAGAPTMAPRPDATAVPPDAAIRRMLADRIGTQGDGIGIVVGVVGPAGRRVIAYGRPGPEGRPFDGDTVFEIGSVTKVFTALLLADMVEKGEVALADPVVKHLPAGVRLPERNGRSITLLDLATHTSGLPFMPEDLPVTSGSAAQPPSAQTLYRYLAGYELRRDIGAKGSEQEYSNLGYWLLGEALAFRGAKDYASLVRERVLLPLHLKSTAFTTSAELQARLAAGHDASGERAPALSALPLYALMPAAGGLVSSVKDLSTFLAVALGYERSPLAPAMAALLRARRPTSRPEVEQALGWVVEGKGENALVVHDGGTLGYASSVAWDPQRRVGVVVLSNQVESVGDLARHLLRPDLPLAKPTVMKHKEIALDAAVLDAYAGRYEAPGEGVFVVASEGGFLTIQSPNSWGLPKYRLRPESRQDFFVAELPLRVTFQTDRDGRVNGMLVYPPRGQKAVPANRIACDGCTR